MKEEYFTGTTSDFHKSRQLLESIENQAAVPDIESKLLLSELLEKYRLDRLRLKKWKPSTEGDNMPILNTLLELLPVDYIELLTHEHAREAKEAIYGFPKNRNKSKKYKHLTIAQIVKIDVPNDDLFDIGNIKKYMIRWISFFNWIKDEKIYHENVFEGLAIDDTRKQSKKRIPFNSDRLMQIFTHPFFTGEKKIRNLFNYWLPLLGLYQGARLSEICGLRVQDIKQYEGIWYMDITPNEYRDELKNDAAERVVPIHQRLIDLGFIDFVNSRPVGLLLDTKKGSRGVKKSPGDWFGRFKTGLGFKKKIETFHSFRHNLISYFKAIGEAGSKLDGVVGHSDDSVGSTVYVSRHAKLIHWGCGHNLGLIYVT